MNTTRRNLLKRAGLALCALPFLGFLKPKAKPSSAVIAPFDTAIRTYRLQSQQVRSALFNREDAQKNPLAALARMTDHLDDVLKKWIADCARKQHMLTSIELRLVDQPYRETGDGEVIEQESVYWVAKGERIHIGAWQGISPDTFERVGVGTATVITQNQDFDNLIVTRSRE